MAMALTNSLVGFLYNGENYEFQNVVSITIEKTQENKLTRGNDDKRKRGIAYKDSVSEADTLTFVVKDLDGGLVAVLNTLAKSMERAEFYVISPSTGEEMTFRKALVSQAVSQDTMDGTDASFDVSVVVSSYDVVFTPKTDTEEDAE